MNLDDESWAQFRKLRDEDQQITLKLNEVLARLHQLGVDVPQNTLKRWAYTEGTIPKPIRNFKGGRANTTDWPEEVVTDAAAVWAVRHSSHMRLSKERIDIIQRAATRVYSLGYAIYVIPPLGISLKEPSEIPYDQIRLQFVSEDSKDLSLFPGSSNKEKAATISSLVVTWLASRVKSRYTLTLDQGSLDTWPVTKPACVHFSWRTIKNQKGREFAKFATLRTITTMLRAVRSHSVYAYLSDADKDEIVLDENGVDTRKLLVGPNRRGTKKGARDRQKRRTSEI